MSGPALAEMSTDQFLAVFTPPDRLLGALAELVHGELLCLTGTGLTGKQGNRIELDMTKVSPEQLMAASNVGRARLRLAVFPDLATFDRYQRLRGAGQEPR